VLVAALAWGTLFGVSGVGFCRHSRVRTARDEVTLADRQAGASRGRGDGTKDGREEAALPTYKHFTSRRSVLADGAGADPRRNRCREHRALRLRP